MRTGRSGAVLVGMLREAERGRQRQELPPAADVAIRRKRDRPQLFELRLKRGHGRMTRRSVQGVSGMSRRSNAPTSLARQLDS
jgi:hypothetical protein